MLNDNSRYSECEYGCSLHSARNPLILIKWNVMHVMI